MIIAMFLALLVIHVSHSALPWCDIQSPVLYIVEKHQFLLQNKKVKDVMTRFKFNAYNYKIVLDQIICRLIAFKFSRLCMTVLICLIEHA